MTTIINAVSGSGLTQTADGSGIVKLQSNGTTTNALAWVNFNGVTTTTIRSQYNVSSITRGGTGIYTVNFTNALADANYSVCSMTSGDGATASIVYEANTGTNRSNASTTSVLLQVTQYNGVPADRASNNVIIFGN